MVAVEELWRVLTAGLELWQVVLDSAMKLAWFGMQAYYGASGEVEGHHSSQGQHQSKKSPRLLSRVAG